MVLHWCEDKMRNYELFHDMLQVEFAHIDLVIFQKDRNI
jgi:hypothetical protein